jgi:hypothetical protein
MRRSCRFDGRDCSLSSWSEWGKCAPSCGFGGTQVRNRNILIQSVGSGVACQSTCVIVTRGSAEATAPPHSLIVRCTCRTDARSCTGLASCPAEPIQPNRSSSPPTFSPDSNETGSPSLTLTKELTSSSPSPAPSTSPTDRSTTRDPTERQVKATHPLISGLSLSLHIRQSTMDALYRHLRMLLCLHDELSLLFWICRHSLPSILHQACCLVHDTAASAIVLVTEFAMKTKARVRALLDGVPTIVTPSSFKF